MSRKTEVLTDPVTGKNVQTWAGFSFPALFFGPFWFIYKDMLLYGLAVGAFSIFTGGLVWLLVPFLANESHKRHLVKSGWIDRSRFKACPQCRELIKIDARLCRFCGSKFDIQPELAAAPLVSTHARHFEQSTFSHEFAKPKPRT